MEQLRLSRQELHGGITKSAIDASITRAREQLLTEEKQEKKSKVTYSLAMDRQAYKALGEFKDTSSTAYQEAKDSLNEYTDFQLVTMLGERFHTGLSTYTARIVDGEIYPDHVDEPMLRMFERGREYRRHHGSQDTAREDAEIIGFTMIQNVLCAPETPVGTMMLSISPPGNEDSLYQHNFYDVFTLKEVNAQRFIETRRYSSALSPDEYALKASEIDIRFSVFTVPTDAEFLAQPIRINPDTAPFKSADDLHTYLHTEHETMTADEFQDVIRLCAALRVSYINTLCDDPDNEFLQGMTFNAILNKADKIAEQVKRSDKAGAVFEYEDARSTLRDIYRYGQQPVRAVTTGCGILEGANVGGLGMGMGESASMGPFSVIEFGIDTDRYGKLTFKCPHCSYENKRPNNTLIKFCQNTTCGRDVSC